MRKYLLTILFMFCTLFAGTAYANTEVSGIISQNTTWDKAGSPYIVKDNIVVDEGATLSITEGVCVLFNGKYYMQIRGKLIAKGSESDYIRFEGILYNNPSIQLTEISSENVVDRCEFNNVYVSNKSLNSIFNTNIFKDIGHFFNDGHNNSITNCIFINSSIDLSGNDNYVDGCSVEGGKTISYGIYIKEGAKNNVIINSLVKNRAKDGIWAYDPTAKIINCIIEGNEGYGIRSSAFNLFGSNINLIIQNCNIINNSTGIYIDKDAGFSKINNNNISGNSIGLQVMRSTYGQNHTIEKNIICNNNIGIKMENKEANILKYNNINDNNDFNIISPTGVGNLIYDNNYWGTTDKTEIENKIFDFYDDYNLCKVIYEPYLLVPYRPSLVLSNYPSGTYGNPITVVLFVEGENYEIKYTLNGSDPTIDGDLYTEPILIDKTLNLKAVSVKEGVNSNITSYSYIIENISSNGSIQGYVQGITILSGIKVELGEYITETVGNGYYQFINIPLGTYNLKASYPFCKSDSVEVIITDNKPIEKNIKLIPGDFNGDNVIDLYDLVILSKNYGK